MSRSSLMRAAARRATKNRRPPKPMDEENVFAAMQIAEYVIGPNSNQTIMREIIYDLVAALDAALKPKKKSAKST